MSEITVAGFGAKSAGRAAIFARARGAARRFLPSLTPPRAPSPGRSKVQLYVAIVEATLAILTGLCAAKAFWALFAPLPLAPSVEIAAAGPVVAPSGAAINPFRPIVSDAAPAASAPVETAVETSLNLALFGSWADKNGGGTAIISVNGEAQKVFAIGEEVCCGATLSAVYPDRVLISRGGARETLRLPNKIDRAGGGPVLSGQQTTTPGAVSGPSLGGIVNLNVVPQEDGTLVVTLSPGADAARFQSFGLREGDILRSFNGEALPHDPVAARSLLSRPLRTSTFSLMIERDGATLPLEINLGSQQAN